MTHNVIMGQRGGEEGKKGSFRISLKYLQEKQKGL
jgi:hypothetical protein